MKTVTVRIHGQAAASVLLAASLALSAPGLLRAQTAAPSTNYSPAQSSSKLSDADLDDLLGPIALYPDALVGIILPASTVPSDVTLAARYLNQNGNGANVDGQPWDESVRALARYPDVLKWMDDNLEWTTSLGEAFVDQPADVMNAVQRLRGEARDKGNLVNTPQQTVVVEKESIRIVPTDPEVIYVPQYNPEVVYVESYRPDYTPLITFGAGFVAGAWLAYDFDWGRRDFYYGPGCGWNDRGRWNDRGYRDGSVNVSNTNITNITNNSTTINRWQPNANSRRFFDQRQRQNVGNARIARANSDARANNPGARRAAVVPKPARLTPVANRNSGKNPARPAVRPNQPGNPNAKPARPNDIVRRPNENRPKAPTVAPRVNGELPRKNRAADAGATTSRPADVPRKSPNAGKPADRPAPAKHRPATAPAARGDANPAPRPHNPARANSSEPARRPNKAPESQERRQPAAPRPQAAPERRPAPRPEAQRPRPQGNSQARAPRPAPQRAQAQGNSGQKKPEGKKKKKED